MPADQERTFSADSAVGRYWLCRCEGFGVGTGRRRLGAVDEVRVGADGAVALVVRRRRPRVGVAVVAAHRVAALDPWAETILLAPPRRRRRGRQAASAVGRGTQGAVRTMRPHAAAAGVWGARAARRSSSLSRRALAVVGSLALAVGVLAQPLARMALAVSRAYGREARRAWDDYRAALAAWRAERTAGIDTADADAPLARAAADDESPAGSETGGRSSSSHARR